MELGLGHGIIVLTTLTAMPHALDFYENADAVAMQEVVRERGLDGFEIISCGATPADQVVVFWAFFRKETKPPAKKAAPKAKAPAL